MMQTRPHRHAQAAKIYHTLAADLDVITRIENSLGKGTRPNSYRSRADFSRLAQYIPNLKT